MWLPWEDAVWLALALIALSVAIRVSLPRRLIWLRDVSQEGSIVAIAYALWQWIGQFSTNSIDHAVARGHRIDDFQRSLHIPSEHWVQQLSLHSHAVIKAANWYYIVGHAPVLGVFLVWLYVRHQQDFARWRTALAIGSILGEVMQIVPVAPPRLTLPNIVDTGVKFGPTVYESNGRGFAPQLAAMPSLHCLWAVIIGMAVWSVSSSRWRWIGPAHAVALILCVVITGNHWWLDAFVGGALAVFGLVVHDGFARWHRRAEGAPPVHRNETLPSYGQSIHHGL